MGTMKFKVGDKVRVRSLEWYDDNKNDEGYIFGLNNEINFIKAMAQYCGQLFTIQEKENYYYLLYDNVFCWQDWMLEDEAFNEEEKQENKNSMETKEMTKEEVFVYLNDTKILCTSKEESKKVQEKLFALGFSYYGEKSKEVIDCAFTLYLEHKKIQFGSDLSMWVEDSARRVEPSEILTIKIKEEKPKFDPKTLRPFDKVLIRDKEGDKWRCNLFCHINEELLRKYFCVFDNWIYCIPYNDETKHLVGTTEDEPEFYRI